ncbi:MAG TPA: tetraacyldisaccharide 4'-kinase [Thermoanaerobaculia bacterium]|nr:tetraacyldisaccharide 4'-kinase [Thermoanaerobaculia bacterium]
MNVVVSAAEKLYVAVNGLRRALYRRGILRSKRLPHPVISIGNITAGGAGKTPAVIALAGELTRRGAKVAVLTRGYGRPDTSREGVVEELDPSRFGDEPVLIKMRCQNVDVIVGANRYDNAIEYLKSQSCDIFILDDGFQHLAIARDLDIVIDAPDQAFHREARRALAAADIVIPRHLAVTVPEGVRNRPLFAFAGLADPAQFFETLRREGLDVRGTMPFPDHHRYTPADLQRIDDAAAAAGAAVLTTTEKDAVKLRRSDIIAVPAVFIFGPHVVERAAALLDR